MCDDGPGDLARPSETRESWSPMLAMLAREVELNGMVEKSFGEAAGLESFQGGKRELESLDIETPAERFTGPFIPRLLSRLGTCFTKFFPRLLGGCCIVGFSFSAPLLDSVEYVRIQGADTELDWNRYEGICDHGARYDVLREAEARGRVTFFRSGFLASAIYSVSTAATRCAFSAR